MGQLDVLKFLHCKGADLFRMDDNNESGIHWAARQGHGDVIEFLQSQGLSVNAANKAGDTPLHLASKQGHSQAVEFLCQHCNDINQPNEDGETSLHLAAMRGHLDTTRCLIEAGCNPDVTDKHGCSALHWALRRHHTAVSVMLLQYGCNIDILDNVGEAPIHIVAREGLLAMAQTLCAFGCKVEVPNKLGQYPLHLAARNGHTELVRCLCLAGCDVELKNKDGIAAEITALAQGYKQMADLLNKLRNVNLREELITQLIPSTKPITKIKLKLFGHSGVGKSTFVDSLKCGYFTSLIRRSVGTMSPKASRHKKGDTARKSVIELNNSGTDDNQLRFETKFDTYTHGVDVQQLNISGIGDISIWEFSGHSAYHMLYDNFIGNTNCIHLVFFSLSDPYEIQMQQVHFWLSFLQSRIPIQEPLGFCGKSGKAARVALVATHADNPTCHRIASTGEYVSSEATSVLKSALQKFDKVFELHETVFVLDAHVVGSPTMKMLKNYVLLNKEKVTQGLPKSTGFLESVCAQLTTSWRKSRGCFPAMPWKEFIDFVHSEVNPLAGEEHMKELIQQLQIMGEVVYIACETNDMVILDPSWLCGAIVGYMLSQENVDRSRVTGIYSADDVQLLFPEVDGQKLLSVLEALQLCTACEMDDEIEYEFPCFNLVEPMDGLWCPSQHTIYGGVRLHCQTKHLLPSLFPRLQVNLRRSLRDNADQDGELYQWYRESKYSNGILEGLITLDEDEEAYEIKVRGLPSMKSECFFFLEDLIGITEQMFSDVCPGAVLERHYLSNLQLKSHSRKVCAYLPTIIINGLAQDSIYGTVVNGITGANETLLNIVFFGAPEVIMFSQQTFSPDNPTLCFRKANLNRPKIPHSQTIPSLQNRTSKSKASQQRRRSLPQYSTFSCCSAFGSSCQMLQDLYSKLSERADSSPALLQDQNPVVVLLPDLHASQLPLLSCQCLCAALDPPDSIGRDWCMLGVLLGMTEKLPKLDPGDNPAFSPTSCILNEWMKRPDTTLGQLLVKLRELERNDAIEGIMPTLPFFRIPPMCFKRRDSFSTQ